MRPIAALLILTTLAACGGSARGPIGAACSASSRSAASPALCRCIQQVASQSLSRADQSRAAPFFADPDQAQATRTRDDRASEAFWRRYKAFASAAEARCG